jgi:4-amino-4-deoxy-L-arabinose transferase-like glycosyltransferase
MRSPVNRRPNRVAAPILLALLTAALYTWRLGDAPVYMGVDEMVFAVNGHAIATTGRDYYAGRFLPLFTEYNLPYVSPQGKRGARVGWVAPLISYAIALSVKVLPFSEATIRLPTAIVGIVDVVLIFLIGRCLFRNEWLAMLAGVLLALTPSHFIHARFAMDYLYPVPFMLGWLLLLLRYLEERRDRHVVLATFCLGAGFYSYIAGALVMSLYLLITFLALWRAHHPRRAYVLAAAGFAIAALPLVMWAIGHPGMIGEILHKYEIGGDAEAGPFAGVRALLDPARIGEQLVRYFGFFNPRLLFFEGPMEPMYSTRKAGVFLLPIAIALAAGIYASLRRPEGVTSMILLLGFVTAPLAATFVNVNDAIYRALEILPFAVLLSCAGVRELWVARARAPRRILLVAGGVAVVVVGLAYGAAVYRTQTRIPGAAMPTVALGAVIICVALFADRFRAGQLVVALLLAIVPLQFAYFGYDYFTDYRRRSASVFASNVRGAFEEVLREDRESPAPAIYLGDVGLGSGPLYWRFYQIKYGRQDVAPRTIEAYRFVLDDVMKLPAGSLVVTNAGFGRIDRVVDDLVSRGEVARRLIADPDGTPTLMVLRRLGGARQSRSPGIAHPGGDAVHGDDEGTLQRVAGLRAPPHPIEQLDLNQIDRIDVGVADVDRAPQHGVGFDQPLMTRHGEDRSGCARELRSQIGAEWLQIGGDQAPVVLGGDAIVGFRQHHLDQIDGGSEERPAIVHRAEQRLVSARQRLLDRALDAQPRCEQQTRLRPRELPRNGAKAFDAAAFRARRRPAADVDRAQLRLGRRAAEVLDEARLLVDDGAVRGSGIDR